MVVIDPGIKPVPTQGAIDIERPTQLGSEITRTDTRTANGFYRTIGAASITTLKGRATWVVKGRCDGTLTEVGRSRVTVAAGNAPATPPTRRRRAGRARRPRHGSLSSRRDSLEPLPRVGRGR